MPTPDTELKRIIPPAFSIEFLTKASPIPIPELLVVKFGVNTFSLISSAIPLPVSEIVIETSFSEPVKSIIIMPFSFVGIAWSAFFTRLLNERNN
ncbi:hypothetical protein D3C73_1519190 [compost metagenome]